MKYLSLRIYGRKSNKIIIFFSNLWIIKLMDDQIYLLEESAIDEGSNVLLITFSSPLAGIHNPKLLPEVLFVNCEFSDPITEE